MGNAPALSNPRIAVRGAMSTAGCPSAPVTPLRHTAIGVRSPSARCGRRDRRRTGVLGGGGLDGSDPGELEFLGPAILQRAEGTLGTAAGMARE